MLLAYLGQVLGSNVHAAAMLNAPSSGSGGFQSMSHHAVVELSDRIADDKHAHHRRVMTEAQPSVHFSSKTPMASCHEQARDDGNKDSTDSHAEKYDHFDSQSSTQNDCCDSGCTMAYCHIASALLNSYKTVLPAIKPHFITFELTQSLPRLSYSLYRPPISA